MSVSRPLLFGFLGGFLALPAVGAHALDSQPGQPSATQTAAPVETGKERLGDKASDEQRVDNCKVPPDRRGTKPRPDSCDHHGAGAAAPNHRSGSGSK